MLLVVIIAVRSLKHACQESGGKRENGGPTARLLQDRKCEYRANRTARWAREGQAIEAAVMRRMFVYELIANEGDRGAKTPVCGDHEEDEFAESFGLWNWTERPRISPRRITIRRSRHSPAIDGAAARRVRSYAGGLPFFSSLFGHLEIPKMYFWLAADEDRKAVVLGNRSRGNGRERLSHLHESHLSRR